MNKKIILERQEFCKFVREGYESNGHDCWGRPESTEYRYVIINSKVERVFNGMYILHNEVEALETGFISNLSSYLQVHLDKDYHQKMKDKRYEEYLKLCSEFENDPVYKMDKKISKLVEK